MILEKRLKLINLILLILLSGCSKYQVVSEVRVNMYHLHNSKTKEAEIIITKDSLVIGDYYRLNSINKIDIEDLK